ncbi:MAG: hypothetical protein AB7R89_21220 [Dehalococcoidia bacterium]
MSALTSRRPFPAWLPPLALIAGIIVAGLIVIGLTRRAAAPDVPPEPDAFQAPSPVRPTTALDVQQAADGRLTLSDGTANVSLKPDAVVEFLTVASAGDIRVGDWLAVIGVPNEVRNFSIRSVVLLDSADAPDEEGVVRSSGGFAGHEAARDQAERPLLGGRITGVDGSRVTLDGPAGPITLDLTDRAPLFRLARGEASGVQEGDRIAIPTGGVADAGAVLVLSGGAR